MLPAVLDPWAGHALFEAAHLAQKSPGQQGLAGQPGPQGQAAAGDDDRRAEGPLRAGGAGRPGLRIHRLVRDRGGAGRSASRPSPGWTARACWCSAAGNRLRAAPGATMQMVGERLGITDQFQGVDRAHRREPTAAWRSWSASRAGGTRFRCAPARRRCWAGPPGNLPEPRNNPQVGMANMRTVMPALQKAKAAPVGAGGAGFASVNAAQTAARDAHREGHAGRKRSRAKSSPGSRRNNDGNDPVSCAHGSRWHAWPSRRWKPWRRRMALGGDADRRAWSAPKRAGRGRPDRRLRRARASWRVAGEAFAQPRYATDAAAAEALCRAAGATLVLAPATSRWARALAGRRACRLGGRVDTHVTESAPANGAPAVTRWFYRQRMEAVLTRARSGPGSCCSMPGCRPAWSGPAGTAAVEAGDGGACPQTRTTRHRRAGAPGRRADHPSGRQAALRGRRRLDQEAGRRRRRTRPKPRR